MVAELIAALREMPQDAEIQSMSNSHHLLDSLAGMTYGTERLKARAAQNKVYRYQDARSMLGAP